MKNVYVVRAVPVRNGGSEIAGWVRVDPLADGTSVSDLVFLRDGSACSQVDAITRLAEDPALLYQTEDEAVRDGFDRLRAAFERLALSRCDELRT